MNRYIKWKYEKKAPIIAGALQKKGYRVKTAGSLAEASEYVFSNMGKGASVGVGGSETLIEAGILDKLRSGEYRFFDRYAAKSFEEDLSLRRESLLADYFISGVNCITEAGEIVNMDCAGNRIAGIAFGSKNVFLIAGMNKVVKDIPAAVSRCYEIAPMNAYRNNHSELPCVSRGECEKCDRSDSMCNQIGIIMNNNKFPDRIHIVLVTDDCGF